MPSDFASLPTTDRVAPLHPADAGAPATADSACRHHALRCLFALLLCAPAVLIAAPKIGVLTMEPGEEYWSRFGHNAVLVVEGNQATSYNFGYFDFDQPGFLARFLRGEMLYQKVALPYQVDMAGYAAEGRGVRVQWLNLNPQQAGDISQALAEGARPENANYRYDYFRDNCSTRVRDVLDAALGGEIQRQSTSRSHGLTLRSEALRLAGPLPWMSLGMHLGLGPAADQPLSHWQEGWVPARLARVLSDIENDGQPLVANEAELFPSRLPAAPSAAPRWRSGFVIAALLLIAGLAPLGSARPATRKLAALVAGMFWAFCGIAGTFMLLLWLATDHWAAFGNRNLLLANPLAWTMLAAVPSLWRGETVRVWQRRLSQLLLVLAAAGLATFWLETRGQENLDWIVLLLPAHLLLAWRMRQPTED